jgi:signal transduction histidine kinase
VRIVCAIVTFVLVLAAMTGAALCGQPLARSVLFFEQSDPNTPFFTEIAAAFRGALNASPEGRVAIYQENLDLIRFRGVRYEASLLAFLKEKYREKPLGSIVAVGADALVFAMRARDELWPEVPIVFGAIDESSASRMIVGPGVTGTTFRLRFGDTISAAKAIVPRLKKVALVGDPLETQTYRRHFRQELGFIKDVEFLDFMGLPIADVQRHVAALPAEAAIAYLGINKDGAGVPYIPREALSLVAAAANRPILIDVETQLGYGGIGGPVLIPALVGADAASLALRVLGGEDASAIPVAIGNVRKLAFDWRELQRFGIDESRLPAGSDVRFRVPGLWEHYKSAVIVALVILLIQSLVIGALLLERRRRRIAELEVRRRFNEVAHLSRAATAGALSASIAHELNQPLGAILSNAEAAEILLDHEHPDLTTVRAILTDIKAADQRASEIIGQLRGLLKSNMPTPERLDLNGTLSDIVGVMGSEAKKNDVKLSTFFSRPTAFVRADRIHIQQVLINLIVNGMDAIITGGDNRREVRLETAMLDATTVEVSIRDTGMGIPASQLKSIFEPFFTTKTEGTGLGLSIVRTIVETYGGKIWAENADGGGAIMRFTFPLAEAHLI